MTSRSMAPSDHVIICEGVSAREFDGEWIVLDLQGGNYFGLDDVGGHIWRAIGEGKSLSQIVASLRRNYDASEIELLKDVMLFIDELVERQLVRINRDVMDRPK